MLVSDVGEEGLLKQIRQLFKSGNEDIIAGIGDDAAVVKPAFDLQQAWTTDMLLEGVHFELDWQTPRELGNKSLAVNLSDIASMGATPRYALLSIACPDHTDAGLVVDICSGLQGLAQEENISVVGGDLTASRDKIVISVTVCGTVPDGGALLRSGAGIGDRVLVTGCLGSASGGLDLLKQGEGETYPTLKRCFILPVARLEAGTEARLQGATAMTDISDGLASDFRHICEESGVGGEIELKDMPIHRELEQAAHRFKWNLEEKILTGGEDYELLFSIPREKADTAVKNIIDKTGVPVTAIGSILPAESGITIVYRDGSTGLMPAHGFNHFQSSI